jgi:hypothetical protein
MSQALKQSKIQILDLPQLVELGGKQQRQIRGGSASIKVDSQQIKADSQELLLETLVFMHEGVERVQ